MRIYGYGYENHSEEVHKVWLSEINWLEQFFLTFWKKTDFKRFWLNIFYQKWIKVQKWEKVSFDGIFEIPIDNLLSIE